MRDSHLPPLCLVTPLNLLLPRENPLLLRRRSDTSSSRLTAATCARTSV